MIDDMAVYIANLGKYNEGYLVGAWFTFPIDEEDVKEKIGLNERYEEYAIHDTDNFPIDIGEYVSIDELNEMYEMIEELPDYIVECLDEFISHYGTLEEVVEHKDTHQSATKAIVIKSQSDKSSILFITTSVRLACLMCAASVYPEPGSNSHIYGIYI